ncbi:MAG: hypothetical protein J6R26_06470 [Paludibacteraceae bacterium]|nr:hypothetical protein [Paludibacteraceae bacterium]
MCTIKKNVELSLTVEDLIQGIEQMTESNELSGNDRARMLAALVPAREQIIELLSLEHENKERAGASYTRAYWSNEQLFQILNTLFNSRHILSRGQMVAEISELIIQS